MPDIHVMIGLPASGKSTEAMKMMSDNPGMYRRLTKDLLREMLDGSHWSKDNEKFVVETRDTLIMSILHSGRHVIVDDTNFLVKHRERFEELAIKFRNRKPGAQCSVILHDEFLKVPVEECIRRDLLRPKSVGESVIRGMYDKYLKPTPAAPIPYNPALPTCIICDIDGTLALMNGRGPYEGEKCDTDLPNVPVVDLVKQLLKCGERVIFVSGRFESVRGKTMQWLGEHIFGSYPAWADLFMRTDGDTRRDSIIKLEIYEREIKGKYNVRFCLDDRDRVVRETWRALGIPCFQVAEGSF